MNKKISLGAAITFMIIVAGITFCITMMVSMNRFNQLVLNVKSREDMYKKLADVDREVRQNFVDSKKMDEEALLDSISKGYVDGIGDKYSTYLTKDEYERQLKKLSGKEVGVGLEVQKDESGYLVVKKIYDSSPAKSTGLQVGDHIVKINDNDLKKTNLETATQLMVGEVGTKIQIVFRRDGVDTPIDLIRKDIVIPYVEMKMIETNAYIKITEFNDSTYSQFKDAIDKAISAGATGLIFDIRNTNGVSIESATNMLNLLLPIGELGKSIDNDGKTTVLATSDKYEVSLPMTTIVNGKTASAAELFVASLRDFKKGNSIGTTTYGKAVVQELMQLTDGSAINLTTARFIPQSGESFDGVGIKPDYEVKLTAEQEQHFDELTFENDPQIQKAIEVINSKKGK